MPGAFYDLGSILDAVSYRIEEGLDAVKCGLDAGALASELVAFLLQSKPVYAREA